MLLKTSDGKVIDVKNCINKFGILKRLNEIRCGSECTFININEDFTNNNSKELENNDFCRNETSHFNDIHTFTEPIQVLISYSVLEKIISFSFDDLYSFVDIKPLEIYFSPKDLAYFDSFSTEDILEICKGANYLEYTFLLELCCKLLAGRLMENPESL